MLGLEAMHLTLFPGPVIFAGVIEFKPEVKRRARGGAGRHYSIDGDREDLSGWALRKLFRGTVDQPFVLSTIFYRPNHVRCDEDNLRKHVLDAGNNVVWTDDHLSRGGIVLKHFDWERPRTELVLTMAPEAWNG